MFETKSGLEYKMREIIKQFQSDDSRPGDLAVEYTILDKRYMRITGHYYKKKVVKIGKARSL